MKHGGTGGVGGGPGGFVTVSVKINNPLASYTVYVITQGIAV